MEEKQPIVLDMHYALFGFDNGLGRPDHAADRLREEMPGVFDGMPTMLPQVEGFPGSDDIPIVHLSSTGPVSVDIARGRADFHIAGRGRQTVAQVAMDLLGYIGHFHRVFAEQRPQRVGFVVRVFYESDEPVAYGERLLSTGFFGTIPGVVETLAIRHAARLVYHGLGINSVTVVDTGTVANIAGESTRVGGIQVTRDFNNVPGQIVDPTVEAAPDFVHFGLDSLALEGLELLLWPKTK